MTKALRRELAVADGDALYQTLIEAIGGLDDAEAMKVMAKLVLLLANHIGDAAVIEAALAEAQAGNRGGSGKTKG